MPRKKYYKKRKYQKQEEIDPVAAIAVLVIFLWIWTYYNIVKFADHIYSILSITLPILYTIIFISIWLLIRKKIKEKKIENEKKEHIPDFLNKLEEKIKEFKPLRKYQKEELYQTGLVSFLQNNYPDVKIEETRHYSRPDIIIEDIAIEIKWPTNMSSMKTLPDKINSYLPKWNYLFIVLFDIKITDSDNNKYIYENKKQEILENIVESKKDKVFFIEFW